MIVAKRAAVMFVPDPERHTIAYARRANAAADHINAATRALEAYVLSDSADTAAVLLAARLRAELRDYDNEHDVPAPGFDFHDFAFNVRYSHVIDSGFTWPPLYANGRAYRATAAEGEEL